MSTEYLFEHMYELPFPTHITCVPSYIHTISALGDVYARKYALKFAFILWLFHLLTPLYEWIGVLNPLFSSTKPLTGSRWSFNVFNLQVVGKLNLNLNVINCLCILMRLISALLWPGWATQIIRTSSVIDFSCQRRSRLKVGNLKNLSIKFKLEVTS